MTKQQEFRKQTEEAKFEAFSLMCKKVADLEKKNREVKSLLYCTVKSCNNCGKVNCENFQRQRIDCCGLWVSYKDYIKELEKENARLTTNEKSLLAERKIIVKENAELKARLNAINLLTPELEKLSKLKTQQLTKAKDLIENIIRVTWGEGWNYSLDWKVKAEQFIKEIEK